jgi:uncharacterized protein (TIGR03437 family)
MGAAPGIFTVDGSGSGTAFVVHSSDYTLVTEQNPAHRGEFLTIFCTGLGQTQPPAISGQPAPLAPAPLSTAREFYAVVDSRVAETQYAGLAPGFVGLYQVNFRVNAQESPGRKWLYFSVDFRSTNQVPIYVQ